MWKRRNAEINFNLNPNKADVLNYLHPCTGDLLCFSSAFERSFPSEQLRPGEILSFSPFNSWMETLKSTLTEKFNHLAREKPRSIFSSINLIFHPRLVFAQTTN